MSYIINNSRGNLVATVADGTVNVTATPITLVGRGVTSYGTAENENYVWILENFANASPPISPMQGQLWYNTDTDVISYYDTSNTWHTLNVITTVENGTSELQIGEPNGVITANVGGTPNVVVITSTGQIVNENLTVMGNTYTANIIPSDNVVSSLGNATHQWKDLYLSNSTIYLGGIALTTSGNGLVVNGNAVVTANAIGTSTTAGKASGHETD